MPLLLAAATVSSCSFSDFHAVSRLPFGGEGQLEELIPLNAGYVKFAAHVQVDYSGDAVARFYVDLLQNGRVVGSAVCDPLEFRSGPYACEYAYGTRDFDCTTEMKCNAFLNEGGLTVVRARLAVLKKPKRFVLTRANLIVGQSKRGS